MQDSVWVNLEFRACAQLCLANKLCYYQSSTHSPVPVLCSPPWEYFEDRCGWIALRCPGSPCVAASLPWDGQLASFAATTCYSKLEATIVHVSPPLPELINFMFCNVCLFFTYKAVAHVPLKVKKSAWITNMWLKEYLVWNCMLCFIQENSHRIFRKWQTCKIKLNFGKKSLNYEA